MSTESNVVSTNPLTIDQVIEHYKNKHFSRTPEEMNVFATQIVADYIQELKACSSKRQQIVDEDGFITVMPKKRKRESKALSEPVFTRPDQSQVINPDLYKKSQQNKKQQIRQELDDLKQRFTEDRRRISKSE